MNSVNVVSGGTGCLNWARPGLWGREADQEICLSLPGANPLDGAVRPLFPVECGLGRGKTPWHLGKTFEGKVYNLGGIMLDAMRTIDITGISAAELGKLTRSLP